MTARPPGPRGHGAGSSLAPTLISLAGEVEAEAQRDCLEDLGCRCARGYYFARPMPVGKTGRLPEERRTG